MSYQFKPDESVARGVRRIVRKELDDVLEQLTGQADGPDEEVVHDVRKRFKKVRAVLKLVRKALGARAYRKENDCLRDAGQPLRALRDARVLVQTLDGFGDQVPAKVLAPMREGLLAHEQEVRQQVLEGQDAFAAAAAAAGAVRGRVKRWDFDRGGWSAVGPGLERTYRDGTRAFAAVMAEPTTANLHEWRKRAKDLWHQLQLLEQIRPDEMKECADRAHKLGDLLGDYHDLAVLLQTVSDEPARFGGSEPVQALLPPLIDRQEDLRWEAEELGSQVYGDRPQVFVRRLKGYWKTWRAGAGATTGS
jgi:CHAD domain-containing protein